MEITEDLKITEKLLPRFNDFGSRILMDKIPKNPNLELLNALEKSWKEIENFEFMKMDVSASFEQLLKRI